MKTIKHILTIVLIILLSGTSVYYLKPDNPFFVWIAVTLGALLLFNILIRKSLLFTRVPRLFHRNLRIFRVSCCGCG